MISVISFQVLVISLQRSDRGRDIYFAGSGKTLISVMLVNHFAGQLATTSTEDKKKMFFPAPKAELVRQARRSSNVECSPHEDDDACFSKVT